MNKAKVKDVDFFKAPDPADLHDMLYDLAYFAVVTRGRYDWYNDEFEWLEKVFTEYENQVPDFIVFRLVNWEPHLMIAPFGRLDRLAIISYFLDYYLSFMYFDATTYKAFGFFGNYHSFFDIANSFRGNHFLILSKPQSTLLC